MDRRLAGLALGTALAISMAGRAPLLGVLATLLIPVTALAAAVRAGIGGWALAMLPGGVAIAAVGTEGSAAYVAGALSGPVTWAMLQRGVRPAVALAGGAGPYAVWMIYLAITGFDPFPAELEESLAGIVAESARQGDVPAEQLAELSKSLTVAVQVLRQTWVASEAVWFWVTLVVAWTVARRVFQGGGFAPLGRFSRFDVPDRVVGLLIGGLVMVLFPGGGGSAAVRTAGWNLISGTGLVYAIRGLAIEWHWMGRGGWRRPWHIGMVVAGIVLFLPVFLATTLGLGLFDTWADFRRLGGSEPGGDSLSTRPPTSGDDIQRKG
jgi:hypothetical protein